MTLKNRYRVLVVDDEVGFGDFISHYLRTRGFEVDVAVRASQALDMFRQQPFDIVLADIMMPAMDGLDMLRQIKNIAPQTIVIMMTAYASLDKAMKAITYDAADLLTKPFELSQLSQVINRVLAERDSSKSSAQESSLSESK